MVRFFPFRLNDDLGAFTLSPGIRPIVAAISSEIPSLNASLLESRPMFLNASTATDGAAAPAFADALSDACDHSAQAPNPATMTRMAAGNAQVRRLDRSVAGS